MYLDPILMLFIGLDNISPTTSIVEIWETWTQKRKRKNNGEL